MADADAPAKRSDLPVRLASAIVMAAVAGGAVWAGGLVFSLFLLALAGGLIWEWWGLVSRIAKSPFGLIGAMLLGVGYIGWALKVVHWLWVAPHANSFAAFLFVVTAVMVVGVDVGAYFTGRTFGGPKIAPRISPSKTWSGLLGGMLGASLIGLGAISFRSTAPDLWKLQILAVIFAILVAVIAQSGDFLESWMKRKAGVKDSGTLIPGHGGLLDRLDGHLMVFALLPFVVGLLHAAPWL
ncbi:MAG: phosphatidate cytidylyltransferase [Novosphingobium sp.]|uniref:phosphatidate cytidylyltransferase n=1 Tax=Novosphingobium sp. TaxID=1874826 RepID=UPI0032BC3FE4